jgi:fatty-acyl-CoA synthase
VLRPEDHDGRLTSAGKPVLNVETRVVDEQMNDAPTGVVGNRPSFTAAHHLLLRTSRKKPRKPFPATGFTPAIWDISTKKAFYISDRMKDVINSGGVLGRRAKSRMRCFSTRRP